MQRWLEQFEEDYKEVIKTAVGGAAGVIHAVDCATTDCQPNENVEALRVFMLAKKIESRPVWKPMHKQPVYEGAPVYTNGVEEDLFKVGFCLPAGPYVTDEDVPDFDSLKIPFFLRSDNQYIVKRADFSG